MNWIGRIIGVLLGWRMGGIIGAVIGFAIGYYFDRARANFRAHNDPAARQRVQKALFDCVFPLLGHMAKADGRVSEVEVQTTEALMARMQLTDAMRQEAIALFKQGVKPDFSVEESLARFMAVAGNYPDVKHILVVYLITMALADGEIDSAEHDVLRDVAARLGFSSIAFEHLLRMAQAQSQFHQQEWAGGGATSREDQLKTAYEALGVQPTVTDAELKKAYRKLMSQYHPDKLVGQGVPEEMVKVATERAQEIQRAYDIIKKHRA